MLHSSSFVTRRLLALHTAQPQGLAHHSLLLGCVLLLLVLLQVTPLITDVQGFTVLLLSISLSLSLSCVLLLMLCQVTLVITDVEGSTELWEWDYGIMTLAQEVHDSVMRSLIGRCAAS